MEIPNNETRCATKNCTRKWVVLCTASVATPTALCARCASPIVQFEKSDRTPKNK